MAQAELTGKGPQADPQPARAPGDGGPPHAEAAETPRPPVTQLGMATLGLIVAGAVYLASKIPHHVPLAPAIALLAVAALVLVANVGMLARSPGFAWWRFRVVYGWTLLAYLVVTGMIEYVFVYDNVRGGTLAVLTGMLAVFALTVPLLIAFTVARHAEPASAR
jgi:hypothetical protein